MTIYSNILCLFQPVFPFQDGAMNYPTPPCNNGLSGQSPLGSQEALSPEAATAAAVAVMAHGLRQQMQMAAVQHHPDLANFNMPSHLTIHPNPGSGNGSSSSRSTDSKLGSPNQILSNGGITMSRIDSPNSGHHSLHGLPNLMIGSGHHSMHNSISPDISPNHGTTKSHSDRNNSTSAHHHSSMPISSSSITLTSTNTPTISLHHSSNPSPIERELIDDDNSIDSNLDLTVEPSVNLAVGVSGMSYKTTPRDFSSPRSDNLFHDDISELVSSGNNIDSNIGGSNENLGGDRSHSRISNYKDTTTSAAASIKIEPIASECRGD